MDGTCAGMSPLLPTSRNGPSGLGQWKPSEIPSAAILRLQFFNQFQPPPRPSLGGSPFLRRGRAAACQRSEWIEMGGESELLLEKAPGTFSCLSLLLPYWDRDSVGPCESLQKGPFAHSGNGTLKRKVLWRPGIKKWRELTGQPPRQSKPSFDRRACFRTTE